MINYDELPEILINYLNYNANLNRSKNSINEYRYDLTRFLKYIKMLKLKLKVKSLDEIDITDVDENLLNKVTLNDLYAYMTYLRDECGNTATSRSRKVASIKGFFKYLHVKAKLIDDNPAKELESPKVGKRLPKYLSLTESQELLDKAKSGEIHIRKNDEELSENQKKLSARDFAMITLFLNCGMRLSELVGINLEHIKFDECILTVIGKGNKQRTVYLNKACINAINAYLNVRPNIDGKDKTALFLSERNQRISNRMVQTIVSKYLKTAGLSGYSTHKLRHTAATLMYQNGVDVRALQEILGHESIGTTEIYTHVDNSQIRQAIENNPLADYETK